jgi:hypothetical protein
VRSVRRTKSRRRKARRGSVVQGKGFHGGVGGRQGNQGNNSRTDLEGFRDCFLWRDSEGSGGLANWPVGANFGSLGAVVDFVLASTVEAQVVLDATSTFVLLDVAVLVEGEVGFGRQGKVPRGMGILRSARIFGVAGRGGTGGGPGVGTVGRRRGGPGVGVESRRVVLGVLRVLVGSVLLLVAVPVATVEVDALLC